MVLNKTGDGLHFTSYRSLSLLPPLKNIQRHNRQTHRGAQTTDQESDSTTSLALMELTEESTGAVHHKICTQLEYSQTKKSF